MKHYLGLTIDFAKAMYEANALTYHNAVHAEHVADTATELYVKIYNDRVPNELLVAAWVHDTVYRPERKDNEIQTSKVWKVFNRSMVNEGDIWINVGLVEGMIQDTAMHSSVLDYPNSYNTSLSWILLDADISGFAEPDYDKYVEQQHFIRQEAWYLTNEEFLKRRKAFLLNLIQKEHLYYTEPARDLYEVQARKNIAADLKALEKL